MTEAAIDFTAATVDLEANTFGFKFPISGGGWIMVDAAVYLGRTIYIQNIVTFGEHSDNFKPNSSSHKLGTKIGTGETRRMLRFVVKRIKQDYPSVDKIVGDRMSGARADAVFSMTDMPI
jgi:hypothetical protein